MRADVLMTPQRPATAPGIELIGEVTAATIRGLGIGESRSSREIGTFLHLSLDTNFRRGHYCLLDLNCQHIRAHRAILSL